MAITDDENAGNNCSNVAGSCLLSYAGEFEDVKTKSKIFITFLKTLPPLAAFIKRESQSI